MRLLTGAILLCELLLISACASRPVEDHYYSLVLASETEASTGTTKIGATRLIVEPIQLPDYLNQRGIVMQVGSNQVQAANHNFWAEPLDEAIAKVLVGDLSGRVDDFAIGRDIGRFATDGECRLRVEFDRFHATNDSRVVNSGRFWIENTRISERHEFDVTQTLAFNGYGHAVDALRESIVSLATKITDTLDQKSHCLAD